MRDTARENIVARTAWAMVSMLAFAAATLLASHHPLWPLALCAAVVVWAILAYHLPLAWLAVVPALAPAMNFSPWTGWIGIEELDLLVLATAAAGYARLAVDADAPVSPMPSAGKLVVAAMIGLTLLGLWRGVADAGGLPFSVYQGYTEALNSWRVGKSVLCAVLLLPLLRSAWVRERERAGQLFALGMLAGAVVVTLAVLWERIAFPGLFNVLSPYRTVGLFWEMHVGGAAIDAYVVLCTPYVAWALWAARTRWQWLAAALFALLWAYVCLTTFSRGAYFGVAMGLLVLGLLLPLNVARHWWAAARGLVFVIGAALLLALVLDEWGYTAAGVLLLALGATYWLRWRTHAARRQRTLAAGMLVLALLFELVVMLGPDSFMSSRLARSAQDYESRTAHWARGIGLLTSAQYWLLGLGLGRLPAHYDRFAPRGEFSGSVEWRTDDDASSDKAHGGYVRLSGPRSRQALGGRYGLTQRVALGQDYRLKFDARTQRRADLLVRACQAHLLYDRACKYSVLRIVPTDAPGKWQSIETKLAGPALHEGRWFAPRMVVLTVAVLNTGGVVDIDDLALTSAEGVPGIANGSFSNGLAQWLPAGQGYFVPWHIDNFYLELLIERGLLGAALLLGIVAFGYQRALTMTAGTTTATPFLLSSASGVLALGLLSSVLDVPRVALLLALTVAVCTLRVK